VALGAGLSPAFFFRALSRVSLVPCNAGARTPV
jgi:hypothetical protein